MIASQQHCDVVIAGGGLAGIVNSILLGRSGFNVILLEKKSYPFHKVCGEYVSNEVLSFLKSLGFNPFEYGASSITKFRMTDQNGIELRSRLDMGGFGLSRYRMDHGLVKLAIDSGVQVIENCRVSSVRFDGNVFETESSSGTFNSDLVIASHGKRDLLDKKLDRSFIEQHTGYMGVKYHIRCEYPNDEIGLDHFEGGYCGIVKIEEEKYNLCYLYRRSDKFRFHEIRDLEKKILSSNPVLKKLFTSSSFIDENPVVINEIYFEKKTCVQDHIIFCGDSAGLITPLCGNGMAMAIHGAALLSEIIIRNYKPETHLDKTSRIKIESEYSSAWRSAFSNRLFAGRQLQKLSGKKFLTSSVVRVMNGIPALKNAVIRSTHGKELAPFSPRSDRRLHQTSRQ